jgi:protein-disulfide isomerase
MRSGSESEEDVVMQTGVRFAIVRSLDVVAAVATLIIVAIVLRMAWLNYQQSPMAAQEKAMASDESASRLIGQVVAIGQRVREHASAKAVILEFSDFQCQYCRSYGRNLYPTVVSELVESGKADYAYRHFPIESLHGKALLAGQAAECAGEQERFWDMHDVLFKEPVTDDQIMRHVQTLRLNEEAFNACLRQGDAGVRVKADLADARRLGIMGTPTFLIGRKVADGKMKVVRMIEGSPALRVLTEAVDEALKAMGA